MAEDHVPLPAIDLRVGSSRFRLESAQHHHSRWSASSFSSLFPPSRFTTISLSFYRMMMIMWKLRNRFNLSFGLIFHF